MDKKAEKQALRQQIKGILKSLYLKEKNEELLKNLSSLLLMMQSRRNLKLAFFHPIASEPNLLSLISSKLLSFTYYLPVVEGDLLRFFEVTKETEFNKNEFGILEPVNAKEIEIRDIDIFIIPGLAFDLHGMRLGRGKGYYDRVLRLAKPGAKKIGVTFDVQVLMEIPSETFDVEMNYLVTETRILKMKNIK